MNEVKTHDSEARARRSEPGMEGLALLEAKVGASLRFAGLPGAILIAPADWQDHRDLPLWLHLRQVVRPSTTRQEAIVE